jgi:hypothetical protein
MTFDEESRALYDAVAPTNPGEYYAPILEELDAVLPPGGSITEHFGSFRSAYVIPPARLYIDGHVDADGAVDWLVRYAMYSPGGARQRLRFVDQYRSYVINYNVRVSPCPPGTSCTIEDLGRLSRHDHDRLR